MSRRTLAALIAAGVAACALGGCATASSSSFTQAPLFFSTADEAPPEASAETLAPYGTLDRGVANYNLVGGNALLPVRAVSLDAGVQANLLGTPLSAGVNTGQLSAGVNTGQLGALNGEAAASIAGNGLTATLGNGTATTVLTTPGNVNTTTVSPGLSTGPSSLITAGPLLGNTAAIAQPPVSNASALLNATSTDLARLCTLRICH